MIGKQIGNYKILKELGRGGMGVVYKAHQTTLGRMIAMKVLPQHLSADAAFIKRFENEARAIASLNHPNIVQIYDIGHEGETHYYTMEFIEGPSLDQTIYRENFLPLDRALNIVLQVARALQYAHSQGIIHRDIKPSNIIIDRSSRAKVADFGLALQERATRLTVDGSIVGTPEYMSPEQAAAEPASVRSDIYSLGVVFYELLTGKVPFEGESALVILKKIQSIEPVWPRALNAQIPLEVEKVIQRMMAKKPRDRYANCQELIQDIRRLKAGQPIPARRRQSLGPRIAIAAVAVALSLGAIILFRTQREPPAEMPPVALLSQNNKMPQREPGGLAAIAPPEIRPLQNAAPVPMTPEEALAQARRQLADLEEHLEELRSRKISPDQVWVDTIIFKKGNKLSCEIAGETLEKVRIKTAAGLAEIPRDEIDLIAYATLAEKQAAETHRLREEERLKEEQQIRKRIEELESNRDELARRLQPPSPIQAEKVKAPPPDPALVAPPGDEEKTAPKASSELQAEIINIPLRESSWLATSSCGKNTGTSFGKDTMLVTTGQKPKETPCSITLQTNDPLKGELQLVEILVEVKRLILADDRITATLVASFDDGTSVEYPFFDSNNTLLPAEISQTPERIRISRPENSVLLDDGWHTLRLPVAEDAVNINKGEKQARISLIHTQTNGGAVYLFRYKAILASAL